jgi:hypothetical protein
MDAAGSDSCNQSLFERCAEAVKALLRDSKPDKSSDQMAFSGTKSMALSPRESCPGCELSDAASGSSSHGGV